MASLGELAVGSIVKLNVNGSATNFIAVHHGLPSSAYDSSCDGTWLLMESIYEKRAWDSTDNDYANSDIRAYLNNTFINLFDSDIAGVIKQAKLPYTAGTGNNGSYATGANGISAKVFLLSINEVGLGSTPGICNEGAVISYFNGAANSNRIAYYNGTETNWWTRSPYPMSSPIPVRYINTSGKEGSMYSGGGSNAYGVRPAVILPRDLTVADDGTIVTSSGGISGQVPINGVMCELTGEGYININGVLCPISDSGVNIGGILNSTKG